MREKKRKGMRILCKSRHEDFQLKVLRGKSHDSKKKRKRMEYVKEIKFLKTFFFTIVD